MKKSVLLPTGIRSIRAVGLRPTWQVVMSAPFHNYLLGEVVSSNSHAVAYGEIAYRMAWFKAHYPAQFWAAFLSHEEDLDGKLGVALAAARAQGVTVLPPDINLSSLEFTSGPGTLRCGLGIVRGIGKNLGEEIIAVRRSGEFKSVADFIRRVPAAGRRIPLTNLVLAGALDCFPGSRPDKLACIAEFSGRGAGLLIRGFQGQPAGKLSGVVRGGVFSDWSAERKLDGEREATGDYLTGHPMAFYRSVLSLMGVSSLCDNSGDTSHSARMVAGIIRSITHRKTKRGGMVVMSVDDETGVRTITMSGAAWSSLGEPPQKGDRMIFHIHPEVSENAAAGLRLSSRLSAFQIVSLDRWLGEIADIHLHAVDIFPGCTEDVSVRLEHLLEHLAAQHPGRTRLRIVLNDGTFHEVGVTFSRGLILQLQDVFPNAVWGKDAIRGTGDDSRIARTAGSLSAEPADGDSAVVVRPFRPPGLTISCS